MKPEIKAEILSVERRSCEALMRGDNTERGTILRMSEERRVVHEQRGIIRDLSKALAGARGKE